MILIFRLSRFGISIMYRRSLARLVRSASSCNIRRQNLHVTCHLGRAYAFQSIASLRVPRCYFSDIVSQDDLAQTSQANATVITQETKLTEILAMKNALELLKAYRDYKDTNDVIPSNEIAVLRCIAFIVQKDSAQRFSLKAEIANESPGNKSVFWDVLDNILEHISESSNSDLASVIWSLGKIGPVAVGFENHSLAQSCDQEILYRDITLFSTKDINKILSGLASLAMRKSKVFAELERAIVSNKIKISSFENQGLVGSLRSFSQTGNGSLNLFELYCKDVYFRGMETFKPFELFQLVSLFAKKGVKADELFSHTEQKVIKMGIESLSNTDIFLILWTFAHKKSDRFHDQVFSHMDQEFVNHGMRRFLPFSLSNTLWCFAKAGKHNANVFVLVKNELMLRDLSAFRKYLPQILWSFAVAEKDYAELYEKIVEEFSSEDLESVSNKDLCTCAWSFGKLGITNENIYRKIEKEVLSRDPSALKYLDIQRLLTGFAHAIEGSRELFEYLEDAILALNVSSLKAAEMCNVLWPFAEMGYKTRHLFDTVEQEILRRGKLHFKEGQLARLKASFEAFGQGSQELVNVFNRR